MPLVYTCQFDPPDRPREDAYLVDEARGIFLVADGVTRSAEDKEYPSDSPAQQAADALLKAVMMSLQGSHNSEEDLFKACEFGNEKVKELNIELGLWTDPDYWERDLAGAVFAGLVLKKEKFIWSYLTDCGVAVLSPIGDPVWHTRDVLTPARKYFPDFENEKKEKVYIRKDVRNKPELGIEKSFGVFTGEDEVMDYLKIGTKKISKDEILVVYSDGAWPLFDISAWRKAIAEKDKAGSEKIAKKYFYLHAYSDLTYLAVYP